MQKHKNIDQSLEAAQGVGKNIKRNFNNISLKKIFKKYYIIKFLPIVTLSPKGHEDTLNSERIQ